MPKICSRLILFQMPRTKTLARKKRSRDGEGSSSRLGTIRYPQNIREEEKEIFVFYKAKKVIKPNVVLDWDVLGQFRLVQQFEQFFTNRAWYNLFMVVEDLYEVFLHS